jgi:hypothetical protein
MSVSNNNQIAGNVSVKEVVVPQSAVSADTRPSGPVVSQETVPPASAGGLSNSLSAVVADLLDFEPQQDDYDFNTVVTKRRVKIARLHQIKDDNEAVETQLREERQKRRHIKKEKNNLKKFIFRKEVFNQVMFENTPYNFTVHRCPVRLKKNLTSGSKVTIYEKCWDHQYVKTVPIHERAMCKRTLVKSGNSITYDIELCHFHEAAKVNILKAQALNIELKSVSNVIESLTATKSNLFAELTKTKVDLRDNFNNMLKDISPDDAYMMLDVFFTSGDYSWAHEGTTFEEFPYEVRVWHNIRNLLYKSLTGIKIVFDINSLQKAFSGLEPNDALAIRFMNRLNTVYTENTYRTASWTGMDMMSFIHNGPIVLTEFVIDRTAGLTKYINKGFNSMGPVYITGDVNLDLFQSKMASYIQFVTDNRPPIFMRVKGKDKPKAEVKFGAEGYKYLFDCLISYLKQRMLDPSWPVTWIGLVETLTWRNTRGVFVPTKKRLSDVLPSQGGGGDGIEFQKKKESDTFLIQFDGDDFYYNPNMVTHTIPGDGWCAVHCIIYLLKNHGFDFKETAMKHLKEMIYIGALLSGAPVTIPDSFDKPLSQEHWWTPEELILTGHFFGLAINVYVPLVENHQVGIVLHSASETKSIAMYKEVNILLANAHYDICLNRHTVHTKTNFTQSILPRTMFSAKICNNRIFAESWGFSDSAKQALSFYFSLAKDKPKLRDFVIRQIALCNIFAIPPKAGACMMIHHPLELKHDVTLFDTSTVGDIKAAVLEHKAFKHNAMNNGYRVLLDNSTLYKDIEITPEDVKANYQKRAAQSAVEDMDVPDDEEVDILPTIDEPTIQGHGPIIMEGKPRTMMPQKDPRMKELVFRNMINSVNRKQTMTGQAILEIDDTGCKIMSDTTDDAGTSLRASPGKLELEQIDLLQQTLTGIELMKPSTITELESQLEEMREVDTPRFTLKEWEAMKGKRSKPGILNRIINFLRKLLGFSPMQGGAKSYNLDDWAKIKIINHLLGSVIASVGKSCYNYTSTAARYTGRKVYNVAPYAWGACKKTVLWTTKKTVNSLSFAYTNTKKAIKSKTRVKFTNYMAHISMESVKLTFKMMYNMMKRIVRYSISANKVVTPAVKKAAVKTGEVVVHAGGVVADSVVTAHSYVEDKLVTFVTPKEKEPPVLKSFDVMNKYRFGNDFGGGIAETGSTILFQTCLGMAGTAILGLYRFNKSIGSFKYPQISLPGLNDSMVSPRSMVLPWNIHTRFNRIDNSLNSDTYFYRDPTINKTLLCGAYVPQINCHFINSINATVTAGPGARPLMAAGRTSGNAVGLRQMTHTFWERNDVGFVGKLVNFASHAAIFASTFVRCFLLCMSPIMTAQGNAILSLIASPFLCPNLIKSAYIARNFTMKSYPVVIPLALNNEIAVVSPDLANTGGTSMQVLAAANQSASNNLYKVIPLTPHIIGLTEGFMGIQGCQATNLATAFATYRLHQFLRNYYEVQVHALSIAPSAKALVQ